MVFWVQKVLLGSMFRMYLPPVLLVQLYRGTGVHKLLTVVALVGADVELENIRHGGIGVLDVLQSSHFFTNDYNFLESISMEILVSYQVHINSFECLPQQHVWPGRFSNIRVSLI